MHGHAAPEVHADRRNLVGPHPNSRKPVSSSALNVEVAQPVQDGAFHRAHRHLGPQSASPAVDDGVDHELPRAVVGRQAAAFGLKQLNAPVVQLLSAGEVVHRAPARRDCGFVLEQPHGFWLGSPDHGPSPLLLLRPHGS